MSKIKTPEETLFRALWKKALELGFQCNETDAHELAIVAKEHSEYRMEAEMEGVKWISIKDKLPENDPLNQRAFNILMKASNDRFYTGYSVTEYGKTTFYQHNGRKVLNVTHWMLLEELKSRI